MPAEVPGPDGSIVTLTPEYIQSLASEDDREVAHQRNRRTAFFVLETKLIFFKTNTLREFAERQTLFYLSL